MAKTQRAAATDRLAAIHAAPDTPVRKQFVSSTEKGAVDAEKRTVTFVITTGSVDRDNDTISASGWDVAEFMKNPSVLWAHDYSQLPVARALDIVPTANGLQSTAQFPPKGVYPFADTVFELIAGGFLNACSVGFRPTDAEQDLERGGINFLRQSLLEWSIVPVPANAEALVVARSKGINVAPLEQWARKVMAQVPRLTGKQRKALLTKALEEKAVDAGLSVQLSILDSYIDAANAAMDDILYGLGIPDPDQMGGDESEMPSAQSQPGGAGGDTSSGLPMPYKGTKGGTSQPQTQPDASAPMGGASGEDGHVPPAGTAPASMELCPACGSEYDGDVCPGCGWAAPPDSTGAEGDPSPMNQPYRAFAGSIAKDYRTQMALKAAVATVRLAVPPKQAANGWSVVMPAETDTVRWNRQHSKAFDVESAQLEPSSLEFAWVSRYLETRIQHLSVDNFSVPSARMGSYLAALDEALGAWTVDATRRMTYSGGEVPPEHETIQLNSRTTRGFLVDGIRFLRRADGVKMVSKLERSWFGLSVTNYIRHDQAGVRTAWEERVQQRAGELNYLRGEAFTLSGEFLDRGDLDWSSMFLEPKQEAVLRRTVDRLNEQGEDLESRGLLLMGPPGTGKTLGGRVMMAQADTTFIWISARDFYRSGAFGAFTYAFDIAAECAPSILFFEDVDNWLGASEVDLLKTEMDGLKRRKGIVTVLTTNFPEQLPDALIDRPGRFHDLMELNLPTEAVRQRMLAAWLPELPEATRAATAKETDGMSGAHLRELTAFAGILQREQSLTASEALPLALAKLREQRDLVASLHDGQTDYRPRRLVRALVGQAMTAVQKRGRVLSQANEGRLRAAREHMAGGMDHMDAVLSKLDQQAPQPQPDGNETAGLAITFADEDVQDGIVLELVSDDEVIASSEDVATAIQQAIAEALRGLGPQVAEQTQLALARARGRVD